MQIIQYLFGYIMETYAYNVSQHGLTNFDNPKKVLRDFLLDVNYC